MRTTKSVAFTGHRHSKLQKDAQNYPTFYEELQSEIRCTCYKLYSEQQCAEFYTGMCDGFDLAAGQAVLQLKELPPQIKLHALLPYDDFGDTFKDTKEQDKYRVLLSKADTISIISVENTASSYLKRNDLLVQNADAMVCYMHNELSSHRSGTLYTVRRAKKKGIAVINLYPLQLK